MRALSFLLTLCLPAIALASGGESGHGGAMSLDAVLHGEHAMELLVAVCNFVMLIFVIRKLAGRPLATHLADRRESLELGMREAAEMKAKAEAVYKEYSERLESLDTELAKLREDIQSAAEADKARILDEAKAEAARLKADTENMVARHAASLGDNIKREVVEAAIAAAEQTLRGALTAEDQRRLADGYVEQLQDGGAA